jgi:hypothetical protein
MTADPLGHIHFTGVQAVRAKPGSGRDSRANQLKPLKLE